MAEISALGRGLVILNPLLVLWTLLQELGMRALFWSRRTAVGLLVCAAGFDVAVLSISGIFFWMWIAVDAARPRRRRTAAIRYSPRAASGVSRT